MTADAEDTTLDVDALRSRFPALDPAGPGGGWALFDAPGGTQTPREVGDAVAAALTGPLSNRGATSPSQRFAEQHVKDFREAMADLLDADPRGVVHGRSATALTYDLSRALARTWHPGDEVVLSRLDHDANVRPWVQAAERAGAVVRWLELDAQTSELMVEGDDDGDVPGLAELLSERTRLVAVTGASNLLGTRPPLRRIADAAHAVGALLWVDGVHATAHALPSLRTFGADFWVCSPYKFLGPHCGVLAADPALLETLHPDKLVPSTDAVPERFEFGTLPYEQLAGVTAAIDVLAGLASSFSSSEAQGTRRDRLAASYAAAEAHEDRLRARIEAELADLAERGAVVVHSRATDRTPTLYFSTPGRDAAAVSAALAEQRVLAPAGWFYAEEPFRALQRAGALDGPGIRVGTAPYTSDDDVTRLLDALRATL
ncbi:cysteine desulfurase family protein, VC1184 subfamily [Quadrisphaera granulorum]|uniref:Cysteine desulfurase family protein (TIGR01976 family) n=1 Tax=Quadrisphaera granulorum TaxID=317664 RepID=A0A315ZQ52_9ACTN|nr:cysteine desulfurase-like protein [Quadrisphaera granulorum]PWJ47120.1 cysteine desulfurase family protein (TIGR01976 family) [Quadrisphaera granulorum]SZE98924.1 cysteine desulfurase family protein, VC1184 subfamily [Quadrisphaera granulorum]